MSKKITREIYEDFGNIRYMEEKLPTLYHGTSDIFSFDILKPACETNNLREEFRNDLLNYVFLTCNLSSAWKYANKAAEKYGGNPVVYITEPSDDCFKWHSGQYLCKFAKIIDKVDNIK